MEPEAIADYEARNKTTVQRIGLGINFTGLKRCCASPDGLVGFDGGLETKTMRPDTMIPLLERGAQMQPEHRAQVFGNMLVFERDPWDFKIYYPGMPPFEVRVMRDEKYIRELHNQIEVFNFDLKILVDKLRSMRFATLFVAIPLGLILYVAWSWDPLIAVIFLLLIHVEDSIGQRELEKEVVGLRLRVADLDRDLLALEASLTGDGK